MAIHKAEPAPQFADDSASTCIHCHKGIKKVPGGHGPVWVHEDDHVVAPGPSAHDAPTFESQGVRVIITHSAGLDGAVVVFVDTDFEPEGSDDGPGLRVLLNDDPIYEGVPYESANRMSLGDVLMTKRDDDTWECSEGCPFVMMRDGTQDDVAHHLRWHANRKKGSN